MNRPAAGRKDKTAIYDVPDSDEAETPRPSRGRKNISAANEPKPKDSVKVVEFGRGIRGRAIKAPPDELDANTTKVPTKPRSVKRKIQTVKEPADSESENEDTEPSSPPEGKRQKNLATQNRTVGRPRKSVSNDGGKREETFEEAISRSSSKSTKRGNQPTPSRFEQEKVSCDEEDEEDDNDEVCAICSKPDSKRGNEIVLCDNCDQGFHQKCYNLAKIPEGDWICRNCSQEEATELSNQGKAAKIVARGDKNPDIANFEQHLSVMQRVLLDRCSGRRRIKLCGQDEAYDKAHTLVEQTIVAGEGNSMLVIGARGCGKTTVRNDFPTLGLNRLISLTACRIGHIKCDKETQRPVPCCQT